MNLGQEDRRESGVSLERNLFHAHLANTLVQIHITLHLTYLINSELENAPFAIFCRGLLECDIEGPL
jgi:hypothetical protein